MIPNGMNQCKPFGHRLAQRCQKDGYIHLYRDVLRVGFALVPCRNLRRPREK